MALIFPVGSVKWVDEAKRECFHELELTARTPVVISMESQTFDTFLRLKDSQGNQVAVNDDIDFQNKNLNSRLVFIPQNDGKYSIVAASFKKQGRGSYTIRVCEYSEKE